MTTRINTGLTTETRQALAEGLSKVLADTYATYQKTHGFHWNVRGLAFQSLHQLFSDQYNEMWTALDEIAERIRALGELAPQSSAAYGNLTSIRDGDPASAAEAMVATLKDDQETVIATLRDVLDAANATGDAVTADLCTRRLDAHEKHAWMLRATLGEV